jgi:hypothetical protein
MNQHSMMELVDLAIQIISPNIIYQTLINKNKTKVKNISLKLKEVLSTKILETNLAIRKFKMKILCMEILNRNIIMMMMKILIF